VHVCAKVVNKKLILVYKILNSNSYRFKRPFKVKLSKIKEISGTF